jgi:hypothetical protein
MQHETNLNIAFKDLKTKVDATHSFGRLALAASIVALFMAGAGIAQVPTDAGGARALTEMSADNGVPHNLLTAIAADEGTPHNLVTAMKADEGVPHNLLTAMAADEGTPHNLVAAMKADDGVPNNLLTAMVSDEGTPHNLFTAMKADDGVRTTSSPAAVRRGKSLQDASGSAGRRGHAAQPADGLTAARVRQSMQHPRVATIRNVKRLRARRVTLDRRC